VILIALAAAVSPPSIRNGVGLASADTGRPSVKSSKSTAASAGEPALVTKTAAARAIRITRAPPIAAIRVSIVAE
jgi:hypothetical protein